MHTAEEKQLQWTRFSTRVRYLLRRGPKALRGLSAAELTALIDDYQALTADLARARSLGASAATIDWLNRTAVAGHNLLYGRMRRSLNGVPGDWFGSFARGVRKNLWAVALAAAMFFGPALICYFAVQFYPALGHELVADAFLDFTPSHQENLHDIPSVVRPVVSSAIITNNVQVTLLAFGFGLTAGIGTTILLIFNGIHLGSVAGWMALQGNERALWGWIMPHGGTELMAICLAGAAGYVLAGAILVPGQVRRSTALKQVGTDALVIEIGCMVMLVVAGLIEGFVSPSGIGYGTRIAVLVGTVSLWVIYFLIAGRANEASPHDANQVPKSGLP